MGNHISRTKRVFLRFKCNSCKFIWTCDYVTRCPNCNGGDLEILPLNFVKVRKYEKI